MKFIPLMVLALIFAACSNDNNPNGSIPGADLSSLSNNQKARVQAFTSEVNTIHEIMEAQIPSDANSQAGLIHFHMSKLPIPRNLRYQKISGVTLSENLGEELSQAISNGYCTSTFEGTGQGQPSGEPQESVVAQPMGPFDFISPMAIEGQQTNSVEKMEITNSKSSSTICPVYYSSVKKIAGPANGSAGSTVEQSLASNEVFKAHETGSFFHRLQIFDMESRARGKSTTTTNASGESINSRSMSQETIYKSHGDFEGEVRSSKSETFTASIKSSGFKVAQTATYQYNFVDFKVVGFVRVNSSTQGVVNPDAQQEFFINGEPVSRQDFEDTFAVNVPVLEN